MITIGEAIQRVISIYNKGVQSDDNRLTPRHVYSVLKSVRSRLVSDEAKKRQKTNQWNYQTLPCVEVIKTTIHECPCLPPIGCEILRTKYKLPKPLTNYDTHLIQSVTSLDGDIIFDEITWKEKKYKSSNKYTGNKPDYFIRNEYLYITASTRNKIKVISLTGLFDDPIEAEKFPSYCNEECTNCNDCDNIFEKPFPIDSEKEMVLFQMAAEELLEWFSKGTEDLTNNTQDNNPEQSK